MNISQYIKSKLFLHLIVALYLLSTLGIAQDKEEAEKYKIVLRMKLRMVIDPLLYLDEPKSAIMNKVHLSSVEYLDSVEANASKKKLYLQEKKMKREALEFSRIEYNRKIPVRKTPNIIYNYFSSSFVSD